MIFGEQMYFLGGFQQHNPSAIEFRYIREKAVIPTMDIATAWHLTPKQCRWRSRAAGKTCVFEFGGELSLQGRHLLYLCVIAFKSNVSIIPWQHVICGIHLSLQWKWSWKYYEIFFCLDKTVCVVTKRENLCLLQRLNCSNTATPLLFQHCGGRHSHLLFYADTPCLQI